MTNFKEKAYELKQKLSDIIEELTFNFDNIEEEIKELVNHETLETQRPAILFFTEQEFSKLFHNFVRAIEELKQLPEEIINYETNKEIRNIAKK